MTEPGIYYPETLSNEQLDFFLAKGWYRMGQGIFSTNYIVKEENIYRVYWLRYNLLQLQLSGSAQKIKSVNKRFTVAIQPLKLNAEYETLYALYKSAIDFDAAESVEYWIYMGQTNNVYDSHIVEVRDQNKLIAAGIFDNGHTSMAGIMNFYDPAYKKYSLGKYLMLLKMQHAIRCGMQWYYPGYIVYGYPKFDYKLFADKKCAELFIPELNGWVNYNQEMLDMLERINNADNGNVSE